MRSGAAAIGSDETMRVTALFADSVVRTITRPQNTWQPVHFGTNTEAGPCGPASLPAHRGAGGVSSTILRGHGTVSTPEPTSVPQPRIQPVRHLPQQAQPGQPLAF